ncbi:MAG: ArnT family glycosyltransferase [Thermomicrobiales bacterium]
MLDRFPTIVVNDEGIFLGEAQHIFDKMLVNPFTTGHYAMANLYVTLESVPPRLIGASLGSYRLAGALIGTGSVLATLLLGRRLFGAWIGLAGASVLALMPLHLWASRSALNNISDAFVLAFAVFFFDRALAGHRRWDAVLTGVVLGLGIYGYFGARAFPMILGLTACGAVAVPIYGRRLPARELIRLGFWMIAGFLAYAAPMLGFWAARPDMFLARFRTSGVVGAATVSLSDRLAVIPDALLYPFFDRHSGSYYRHGGIFFRHDPPFLGWLLVPFVAIGIVCWGVWAIRGITHPESRADPRKPRPELLLIPWIVISAAIAQTESMESQRFLSITMVWALAAGTGLVVAISALGPLLGWSRDLQPLALLIAMIGIGAWHANFYFSEDRQISMYGESGATAVWDIAWRTQQMDPLPLIVLAGSPTMNYEGYGQWTYMVPGLAGLVTDVPAFGSDATKAPEVPPSELVMVGGRRDPAEPCAVQTRNPTAMKGEARDRYGTLLYTVFTMGPTLMLPTAESPGESTLTPVTEDLCTRD